MPMLGKKHSEESKKKMSLAMQGKASAWMVGRTVKESTKAKLREQKMGEKNPNWIGNKINRSSVHGWIRKYLPRPELCEICNKNIPKDISNISKTYNPETYTRDFKNWRWLCRSCHWTYDGKVKNFHGIKGGRPRKYEN